MHRFVGRNDNLQGYTCILTDEQYSQPPRKEFTNPKKRNDREGQYKRRELDGRLDLVLWEIFTIEMIQWMTIRV